MEFLPPFGTYEAIGQDASILNGMKRKYAPLNDWIHDALRESVRRVVRPDEQYTRLFDELEILIAVNAAMHYDGKYPSGEPYFVAGAFGYRADNAKRFLKNTRRSVLAGASSPLLKSGILGDSAEECKRWLDSLEEWIPQLRWGPWWR